MSYILEALKKAQAERQLGEVPSVHAPSMQMGSEAPAGGKLKMPMLAALLVMGGVIVALLALVWGKTDAGHAAPAGAAAALAGPAVPAVPAATAAPAPAAGLPSAVAAAPAPAVAAAPPVTSGAGNAPLAASHSQPAAVQPSAAEAARPAAARAESASAPALAPKAPAPVAAQEEVTQTARDLPEPIQRALPNVAIGGYIYSKDPADRLLLVDKVLRHEGDEVAPGLVLEKLQPKSAIFSFKGYRYRVPY